MGGYSCGGLTIRYTEVACPRRSRSAIVSPFWGEGNTSTQEVIPCPHTSPPPPPYSLLDNSNSGIRGRMTVREMQPHFEGRRAASENGADTGNCLNATEISRVRNSVLSQAYRRPTPIVEEDMTRLVDTKGRWGKDDVMMAERGAWVVSGSGNLASTDALRIGINTRLELARTSA